MGPDPPATGPIGNLPPISNHSMDMELLYRKLICTIFPKMMLLGDTMTCFANLVKVNLGGLEKTEVSSLQRDTRQGSPGDNRPSLG